MNNSETINLFLVDDDAMFLKSLEHLLHHRLKYKVKIKPFQTGEEYLKSLDQQPDIVVLDYILNTVSQKPMNGINLLRQTMDRYPSTTVIMLSAQEKMEVAIDCIKHGAYDYVIKNDNAILRLHTLLRNAISSIQLRKQMKGYNLWVKLITVVIVLLLVTAMVIELFFQRILH